MQDLNIALVQTHLFWEDREANLDHFNRLVSAIETPVDLILLPEMFSTGFSMKVEKFAEAPGGMFHQWMAGIAATKGAAVAGSLMVKERGYYYNRFVWTGPEGEVYTYDKKHLFRMGDEPSHYSAGRKRTIISFRGWNILPLVCYDLRFPVWSMNSRIGNHFDYDLLLYAANWPSRRSRHWRTLLQARAIENQAYVAAVNRTGHDGSGVEHTGDSLILDPLGDILADAGNAPEQVLRARLDKRFLDNYRDRFAVSLDWDRFDLKD